ncbi:pyridoxine 5'-phosphate synthase [bacterium]|nr:pyridoxine 5'-phosphate synthase [bacterium]
MIKLSVNVNKIATLRNSRGGTVPSVTRFAQMAIDAGAHGITVHPRPDERHIRRTDVTDLRPLCKAVEFNIEGYPDERYCQIIEETRPDQATLVPDPPGVLTSNAGWKAREHQAFLRDTIARLKGVGARVSVFMETNLAEIDAAREAGADRIEFYTGPFAEEFAAGRGKASYQEFATAAQHAVDIGLGINAGHDLDLENLVLMRNLPGLAEVSIGHALVRDALLMGWQKTIGEYLRVLQEK